MALMLQTFPNHFIMHGSSFYLSSASYGCHPQRVVKSYLFNIVVFDEHFPLLQGPERLWQERTTQSSCFQHTYILWGLSARNSIFFSEGRCVKGPAWAWYSSCAQFPDGYKILLCILISRKLIHYFLLIRFCKLKGSAIYLLIIYSVLPYSCYTNYKEVW